MLFINIGGYKCRGLKCLHSVCFRCEPIRKEWRHSCKQTVLYTSRSRQECHADTASAVVLGPPNSFRDIFMEQDTNNTDNFTPFVDVEGDPQHPTFAADLFEGFHPGLDTANSQRCVVSLSPASRVNISNLSLSDTSSCAINDRNLSVSITGHVNSVIASYDMTPRFLGAMTVSSLPPAASSNAAAMFRVTDSTAINAEGQSCIGGGTNTALAFSNGSVWKCFSVPIFRCSRSVG